MMAEKVSIDEALRFCKAGDIIGFAGRGFASTVIRSGAVISRKVRYGKTWSHVGIVAPDIYRGHSGVPTMIESTTMNTEADIRTGLQQKGVSEVYLDHRLLSFSGKVFIRPLKVDLGTQLRRRYAEYYARYLMGHRYENMAAPGGLWNVVDAELFDWIHLGDESREGRRIFCSELVAQLVREFDGGAYSPITRLPSQTSPTDCRFDWGPTFMTKLWRLSCE